MKKKALRSQLKDHQELSKDLGNTILHLYQKLNETQRYANLNMGLMREVMAFFGEKGDKPPRLGYVPRHLRTKYTWLQMTVGGADDMGECWVVPEREMAAIRDRVMRLLEEDGRLDVDGYEGVVSYGRDAYRALRT